MGLATRAWKLPDCLYATHAGQKRLQEAALEQREVNFYTALHEPNKCPGSARTTSQQIDLQCFSGHALQTN